MIRSIEYYQMRLHALEQRDPVANRGIIAKLTRRIRALESAQHKGQE